MSWNEWTQTGSLAIVTAIFHYTDSIAILIIVENRCAVHFLQIYIIQKKVKTRRLGFILSGVVPSERVLYIFVHGSQESWRVRDPFFRMFGSLEDNCSSDEMFVRTTSTSSSASHSLPEPPIVYFETKRQRAQSKRQWVREEIWIEEWVVWLAASLLSY